MGVIKMLSGSHTVPFWYYFRVVGLKHGCLARRLGQESRKGGFSRIRNKANLGSLVWMVASRNLSRMALCERGTPKDPRRRTSSILKSWSIVRNTN